MSCGAGDRGIGWALLALALALVLGQPWLPEGLQRLPAVWVLPFADWINAGFAFLRDDLGLLPLTRAFADALQWLLDVSANLLYGKRAWPRLEQPIPWSVIAASAALLGYALRGPALGLLCGATFVWIALLGQWKWAMQTLSVIGVAAPIAVAAGLLLGVAVWRFRYFRLLLDPLLNLSQSLPHFSYMIPVVVFIGVGPKAGAIVTIIFAMPPMIRLTLLGLQKVPPEVVESGQMSGASRWQLLRHVCLPSARSDILIGVNQVIMQSLAMVVLASFIGMPGLGQKLLQLLQSLKIGRSIEIGITIVLLAVVLDRCSRAWAERQPVHHERGTAWYRRHALWLIWLALVLVLFALSQWVPELQEIKRRSAFSLARPLDRGIDALIGWIDPFTLSIRAFLIKRVLVPMRDAYLWLPFSAVIAALAGLAWRLGGARSASVVCALIGYIALSGWWDRAMITAYMVSFAVLVAAAIGMPLGIWAAGGERRARFGLLLCDTAQTFPSFIYLIPVVMLFGVSDVAAIGAVVVFALVPLMRYTIEGLRGVPPTLIEASAMCGASRRQALWRVRFPLALPTLMVGLNQSIMFSLFMVIIAAFIGTQDLGQEMQRALSSTDVGKGLVLGLCVAAMGLCADHLAMRWARARRQLLGLD